MFQNLHRAFGTVFHNRDDSSQVNGKDDGEQEIMNNGNGSQESSQDMSGGQILSDVFSFNSDNEVTGLIGYETEGENDIPNLNHYKSFNELAEFLHPDNEIFKKLVYSEGRPHAVYDSRTRKDALPSSRSFNVTKSIAIALSEKYADIDENDRREEGKQGFISDINGEFEYCGCGFRNCRVNVASSNHYCCDCLVRIHGFCFPEGVHGTFSMCQMCWIKRREPSSSSSSSTSSNKRLKRVAQEPSKTMAVRPPVVPPPIRFNKRDATVIPHVIIPTSSVGRKQNNSPAPLTDNTGILLAGVAFTPISTASAFQTMPPSQSRDALTPVNYNVGLNMGDDGDNGNEMDDENDEPSSFALEHHHHESSADETLFPINLDERGKVIPPRTPSGTPEVDELTILAKLSTDKAKIQLWTLMCSLVQEGFEKNTRNLKGMTTTQRFQIFHNLMQEIVANYPTTQQGQIVLKAFNQSSANSTWPRSVIQEWEKTKTKGTTHLESWKATKTCALSAPEKASLAIHLQIMTYIGSMINDVISETAKVVNNYLNSHCPHHLKIESGESVWSLLQCIRRHYWNDIEGPRRVSIALKTWICRQNNKQEGVRVSTDDSNAKTAQLKTQNQFEVSWFPPCWLTFYLYGPYLANGRPEFRDSQMMHISKSRPDNLLNQEDVMKSVNAAAKGVRRSYPGREQSQKGDNLTSASARDEIQPRETNINLVRRDATPEPNDFQLIQIIISSIQERLKLMSKHPEKYLDDIRRLENELLEAYEKMATKAQKVLDNKNL